MLNAQQQIFVEAYLVNFSATEAHREAGYKGNHGKKGSVMLNNPKIKTAIDERLKQKKAVFRVREEEILKGIHQEAINPDARPSERIQAWVHLGKHVGMFKEKEEKENSNITYNIVNYNKRHAGIEQIEQKVLESNTFNQENLDD